MAHTVNHVWEQVIDFKNLSRAYRAVRRGMRYRRESRAFAERLEENLIILQNELLWGMYKPQPLRPFYGYEPKKRFVAVPSFRDRLVYHAVVQVIKPLFEKKWMKETFLACLSGKGTHAAGARHRRRV